MYPIDAKLGEITRLLSAHGNLVIEAPPGAGKTTRVPAELLQHGFAEDGEIIVLQPRRIAARRAAEYVARSMGEPVGRRCGYQVRFDRKTSEHTKIRFVTEGVLLRQLRQTPQLPTASVVIFDEFHERHIEGDVAMALLRKLQSAQRPDLKLIAMSATLDTGSVASFLDAPTVRVDVRRFETEIEYCSPGARDLARQVLRVLSGLPLAGTDGHVLVFLPGAREIRDCGASCSALARASGFEITPLHGDLSAEAQDQAVGGSASRRLILATNVAETSLTIDNIAVVIDSGLARRASHDPWTGMPRLDLVRISRASATQRAGRAGRTRPGRCLRLYSRHDHDRRPAQTTPEIQRVDLSATLLDLAALKVDDPTRFPWFEAPRPVGLRAASELLELLGATEAQRLTDTGRAMLRFSVHPRIARFLVACEARGVAELGARVAAVLGERSMRSLHEAADQDADADVLVDTELIWPVQSSGPVTPRGVDLRIMPLIKRSYRQIVRSVHVDRGPKLELMGAQTRIREALLQAYPDRVARVRDDGPGRRTLVFADGGSAVLSAASVLRSARWAVALVVEERREERGRARNTVRSASAIEPEWLIELCTDRVVESETLVFDPQRERVVAYSELRYGTLSIESFERTRLPPGASDVLARAAISRGPATFIPRREALAQLCRRITFAAEYDESMELWTAEAIEEALRELCIGRTTFAELRAADLMSHLLARMGHGPRRQLDRLAPTHVRLPGGRRLEVHYESDRPPWVQSRLQDFFGRRVGPRIAMDQVALVLHLLAPNGRPVQVTTDLGGFWARHYPGLRNALHRRYPKHGWPEDPANAEAPQTARPRSRARD
ncbi:MAG: ATP-dependent helicase HrpB [Nannocystaceae bacterium]